MACCHTFPLKVKWCGGGLFEVGEKEEKKEVCLEEDFNIFVTRFVKI